MRRTGTRDLQDMDAFEKYIRKKFVFMRWYRGSMSMTVTGCLVISILLSLMQVGSLLFSMGHAMAQLAGMVLPWTLSCFAVACAWWCFLPPLDPTTYITNLNEGIKFLNLHFDTDTLSFRHTAPAQGFPSPPSPLGTYWNHPPSLPQLANTTSARVPSRPSTPPPSPISGAPAQMPTQLPRSHFTLRDTPQFPSHMGWHDY
eukprot:TRINITY_DN76328_c0_g1_i1.p1 TRINITY_DN76328_c0_g1~~TRINITY_DN76328_c0_g1_i1.p1  ORF type:complete len:221 (+),score=71.79 TRINITY_DN76328_c0_g1_i1:62-664(+)